MTSPSAPASPAAVAAATEPAITAQDWVRLSALLDQALALEPAARTDWLSTLPPADAALKPALAELLARAASETDEFMRRPALASATVAARTLAAPVALATDQSIGPYRLLRELGTGGMGAVWLAERADGSLKRQVALKLPRVAWAPGLAQRMTRERDILAALEHPHIARLYDAGVDDGGRPYLAMEYVEGRPIDRYVREAALPVRARLQLFLQVTAAVAYAHARLTVHRDLKPSNILVTADGQVRLLDFGIAKLLEGDSAAETQLTELAGRALTPDYAAPEQIRGEPITVATDVYALGVVLYELLAGQRPYRLKRDSRGALEDAILTIEPPPASSLAAPAGRRALTGDLDAILNKTLKKPPAERYPTVDALADDLQRHLDGLPVIARPDSLAYRLRKFVVRHAVALASVSAVIVALVAGLTSALWQAREAARQRDAAIEQQKIAVAQERFGTLVLEQIGPAGALPTREELIDRSVQILHKQFGDDPRFVAQNLIRISGRYMNMGLTAKELAVLETAERLAREIGDDPLLIRVHCNTVETELEAGRTERGVQRLAEAQALLARAPKAAPRLHVTCMNAAARLASFQGRPADAVRHIEDAIAAQERISVTTNGYRSLLSHAQGLYRSNGQIRESLAVGEKLARVEQVTGTANEMGVTVTATSRALSYLAAGEVARAFALSQEAVALAGGLDETRSAHPATVLTLGSLLLRLDRAREARRPIERALESARDSGSRLDEIRALATLAELEARLGREREAIARLAEARRLAGDEPSPWLLDALMHSAAAVELAKHGKSGHEVVAGLLASIDYPSRVHPGRAPARSLVLAARLELAAGSISEASRYARDALIHAERIALDPARSADVGEARLVLAEVEAAAGRAEQGREFARAAVEPLAAGLADDHPLTLRARALSDR